VRHIVELHGGTIDAESPGVGSGATFTVRLPRRSTTDASAAAHAAPDTATTSSEKPLPRLDGTRLLIIDDEQHGSEAAATLLFLGAEVRTASTLAQALATIREWQPAGVIADLDVHPEDAYRFVADLRAHEELGRIPAIALTTYATRDDRLRMLEAGFRSHVTKPVDPLELATTILNVLAA